MSCPALYCRTPSGITFPEKIYLKASIPDYQRLLYDQVTDTTTKKQACKGITYDNTIYIIYIYIYILHIHTEKVVRSSVTRVQTTTTSICKILLLLLHIYGYLHDKRDFPARAGHVLSYDWCSRGVLIRFLGKSSTGRTSFCGWTLCLW